MTATKKANFGGNGRRVPRHTSITRSAYKPRTIARTLDQNTPPGMTQSKQRKNVSSKVNSQLSEDEKRRKREWQKEQEEIKRQKKEEERQRMRRFKEGIKGARSRISKVKPSPFFRRSTPKVSEDSSDHSPTLMDVQDEPFRQPDFSTTPTERSPEVASPKQRMKKKKSISREQSKMKEFMAACREKYNSLGKPGPVQFEMVLGPGQNLGTPEVPTKPSVETTPDTKSKSVTQKIEDAAQQRETARQKLAQNLAKQRKFCKRMLGKELYKQVYDILRQVQKNDNEDKAEEVLKKILTTTKQWACIKHMHGIIYCEDVMADTSTTKS